MQLFVYGTLKRGQVNHLQYVGADAKVEAAQVRGHLVQLRQGYPMLVVPAADVLAIGTADYSADGNRQQALNDRPAPTSLEMEDAGTWPVVQGEIVELTDVLLQLPPIDALEDFDAATGAGLYHRALLWAVRPRRAVWTYIAPEGRFPQGALEWGAQWP